MKLLLLGTEEAKIVVSEDFLFVLIAEISKQDFTKPKRLRFPDC